MRTLDSYPQFSLVVSPIPSAGYSISCRVRPIKTEDFHRASIFDPERPHRTVDEDTKSTIYFIMRPNWLPSPMGAAGGSRGVSSGVMNGRCLRLSPLLEALMALHHRCIYDRSRTNAECIMVDHHLSSRANWSIRGREITLKGSPELGEEGIRSLAAGSYMASTVTDGSGVHRHHCP